MRKIVKTGAAALLLVCMGSNVYAAAATASGCARPADMNALKTAAMQQRLMVAALSCGETQSYNPTWMSGGCVATASQLMGEGFAWSAKDVDTIGSEVIATRTVIALTEGDIVAGQKVLSNVGSVVSITFRLGAP